MDKEKIYELIKPVIISNIYQTYFDRLPKIMPYNYEDAIYAYRNDSIFSRQVERCMANIMLALDEQKAQSND